MQTAQTNNNRFLSLRYRRLPTDGIYKENSQYNIDSKNHRNQRQQYNADSAQCLLITQAFASQHNTSDCDYQQKNGGSDKQCRRSCPPF